MDSIPLLIKGRGKLVGEVKFFEGNELLIRVDDERNDEFWLEIPLSRGDLQAWISQLEAKNGLES